MPLRRPYFEFSPHKTKRWGDCVGCFLIEDVQPFIDVWNRYADRWNEVEIDRKLPFELNKETCFGAHISSGPNRAGPMIHHPDFHAIILIKRWNEGLWYPGYDCRRSHLTPERALRVECHYRSNEVRNAVYDWLALERELFGNGNNHYDALIAHRAKLAATA